MSRPRFSCSAADVKQAIRNNLLPILTISGVTGGILLGFILRFSRSERWSKREVMYVGYLGELFLRALKALIIPLIVSSLVSAIGSLDLSLSKKIGLRAIAYYITTTVSAVILGIILVVTIHPGKGNDDDIIKAGEAKASYTPDLLMDLPRNLFPPNLIQACFETELRSGKRNTTGLGYDSTFLLPKEEWDIKSEHSRALNIMGLVSFATVLGLALSKLGPQGEGAGSDFFHSLSRRLRWSSPSWLILDLPRWDPLRWCLHESFEMEDFSVMLGQLGLYFGTVVLGIFIHGLFVLPTIYTLLTRRLPFRFLPT
nr:excitatory amino acid transporter 1-like [Penaeus vannamei]